MRSPDSSQYFVCERIGACHSLFNGCLENSCDEIAADATEKSNCDAAKLAFSAGGTDPKKITCTVTCTSTACSLNSLTRSRRAKSSRVDVVIVSPTTTSPAANAVEIEIAMQGSTNVLLATATVSENKVVIVPDEPVSPSDLQALAAEQASAAFVGTQGCCRVQSDKSTEKYGTHTQFKLAVDEEEICKALCAVSNTCTAFELKDLRWKGKLLKNTCEIHTGKVTAVANGNLCKKSSCSVKTSNNPTQTEPQRARTPSPTPSKPASTPLPTPAPTPTQTDPQPSNNCDGRKFQRQQGCCRGSKMSTKFSMKKADQETQCAMACEKDCNCIAFELKKKHCEMFYGDDGAQITGVSKRSKNCRKSVCGTMGPSR